jgi:FkbM family methyltransferase
MKPARILVASALRRILLPLVPARMKLPVAYWLQGISAPHEPEVLNLDHFIALTGTAIDIGANVGFFTYALARRFRRVYAFEANDEVTGLITEFNAPNVELIHCGLSDEARTARFYIPVSGGVALSGWGSLNRNELPGAEQILEKQVKVAPLDDFKIGSVDFIKIDVEGHEIEVLHGASATIENSRPIVLIELKTEHVEEADAWFRNLDYKHCRLEDFIDATGHRSNHIFVPLERLAGFGIARPVE